MDYWQDPDGPFYEDMCECSCHYGDEDGLTDWDDAESSVIGAKEL